MSHPWPSVLAILSLSACTVGPDYVAPDAGTTPAWTLPSTGAVPQAGSPWWETFQDPVLNQLMSRARQGNLDIQRAEAVVAEARAAVSQARAGGLPQLGGSVSGVAGRVYNGGYASENYGSSGFDASWEIDLWGKTRRSVEAAKANQGSAEANVEDARLTLLGDVARNYFQLRGAESRIATLRVTVGSRRRLQSAAQIRFKGGDGTQLDVLQAESAVLEAGVSIATLEGEAQVSLHAIAILCGLAPSELPSVGGQPGHIGAPPLPGIGVPADLVRRRPDVRVAERQLAQAVAQIGVAVAGQYPSLTLNGNVGLSGVGFANVLAQPIFALTPRINLPIFDGGRNSANIEAARAKADEARLIYRAAVLKALQDVEDAMARLHGIAKTVTLQQALVASSDRQVEVSRKMFVLGGDSFLPVLDAQRSADSARLALAQNEADRAVQTVALFKALAGGWAAP